MGDIFGNEYELDKYKFFYYIGDNECGEMRASLADGWVKALVKGEWHSRR